MGEIIEKGLLIGFGLTLLIFMYSFISPFLLYITNTDNNDFNTQYNEIVFRIGYASTYTPRTDNETSKHNFSLQNEITIKYSVIFEKICINVSSKLKSTIIETKRNIIFETTLLTGSLSIEFYYHYVYTEMKVFFYNES